MAQCQEQHCNNLSSHIQALADVPLGHIGPDGFIVPFKPTVPTLPYIALHCKCFQFRDNVFSKEHTRLYT